MEDILKRGSRGDDVKKLQKFLKVQPDGIYGKLTEEAVRDFQERNGLRATGEADAVTWNMAYVHECGQPRKVTEIIVHCTATPEGRDYSIADITLWHKERGFSTIGYHYVVSRDGRVMRGRDVAIAGAHCVGHNTHSVGIAYIGGVAKDGKTAKDTRTKEQRDALRILMKSMRIMYPKAKIYGHRDFSNKACPCFDAKAEYSDI